MHQLLIVEDDLLVAATLRSLVELEPDFQVVAMADNLETVRQAVCVHDIHFALVDIQLSSGSTGYAVAAELSRLNVSCIFVTGNVPPFAMPEFAIGCVTKPFTAAAIADALHAAISPPSRRTRPPQAGSNGFQLY